MEGVDLKFRDDELRVQLVFKALERLPEDEEIRSHWTRYLCILTAGLLETGLREIMVEYVRRNSDKRIQKRFSNRQHLPLNPKKRAIISTLYDFDKKWGEEIEKYITDEKGDKIDSVMNNRNRIAHGQDVSVTSDALNSQYREVVRVVQFINDLVLTQSDVAE